MHQLHLIPQYGKTYLAERLVYTMKYTVKDLQRDFPNDDACLKWLVKYLYPRGIFCIQCDKATKHYKIKNRRVYSCGKCGWHVSPTAGTIFHKSSTPLTDWFYAIYMMSSNKAGTSAKQIERELGCTYKTAWRMMHKIRTVMEAPDGMFTGEVEIDETFIHPNTFKRSSAQRKFGFDSRRTGNVVVGIVKRGGPVKVFQVDRATENLILPKIWENVKEGTRIHTDGWPVYSKLPGLGYRHRWTEHGRGEYYRADSHTQNIENVWSHFKRGIRGVYRHIDKKYVQNYANEFAWRYSHRHSASMFLALLDEVAQLPSLDS